MTEEHKRKIGLANKGRKRPDLSLRNKFPEMRERVKQSKLGKPRPDSVKKVLSLAHKGKKLSEEHKRKIGEWNIKHGKRPPIIKGEKSHLWKGGKIKAKSGYIYAYSPDHPNATKGPKGYIFEHRLVMENKLGRYLIKGEVVHHINGNKTDNRIENLMLFSSHSKHIKFHQNH